MANCKKTTERNTHLLSVLCHYNTYAVLFVLYYFVFDNSVSHAIVSVLQPRCCNIQPLGGAQCCLRHLLHLKKLFCLYTNELKHFTMISSAI